MAQTVLDFKDPENYDVKNLTDPQLRDDFRLILSRYCSKKQGKDIKMTYPAIIEFLKNIIVEIKHRDAATFKPKQMKSCAREAFMQAAPKDVLEDLGQAKLSGLYLVEPHGKLIWDGKKTMVIKSQRYKTMTKWPMYLISGKLAYGEIEFEDPIEIESIKELRKLRKEHRVTEEERKAWCSPSTNWCEPPFYGWRIKKFTKFKKPKNVKIPQGIQTFVTAAKIKF